MEMGERRISSTVPVRGPWWKVCPVGRDRVEVSYSRWKDRSQVPSTSGMDPFSSLPDTGP